MRKRNEENTELVQALRQCDGGRVQCLVMVRDDFWLAVSRFMQALEMRVLEGQNCPARRSLRPASCPQGAGGLRPSLWRLAGRSQATQPKTRKPSSIKPSLGLAQEGKVISVRLALFAEMVKGKPWTPATLKEVGGTEGVGVTFLEETFTASTAPPQHRLHQKAAQAVLKALLPEAGTDIKGTCGRSRSCWKRRAMPAVPRTSTTCSAFSTANSASSRRPTRKARTMLTRPRS